MPQNGPNLVFWVLHMNLRFPLIWNPKKHFLNPIFLFMSKLKFNKRKPIYEAKYSVGIFLSLFDAKTFAIFWMSNIFSILQYRRKRFFGHKDAIDQTKFQNTCGSGSFFWHTFYRYYWHFRQFLQKNLSMNL